MSDKKSATSEDQEVEELDGLALEEADQVLAALRELIKKVSSPVIKECLRSARADIVHLAASQDETDEDGIGEADLDAA